MGIRSGLILGIACAIITACSGESLAPAPATYSIGGTVSGLSGTVILQNNGTDTLMLSADGAFAFATRLASSSSYNVTIQSQPAGQVCTVSSTSGTVASTNVTNVGVNCVTLYSIGGTVSGLSGTLILQNNGTDTLTLSANGPFAFATTLASTATYNITIQSQPAGQVCTASSASGAVAGTNVIDIGVSCVTLYSIGGTVSGLSGPGLVLQNNGGNDLSITANGSFTFAALVANGAPYNVTVLTQPSNGAQICSVTVGNGVVSGAAVTGVIVLCKSGYTIGTGTVTDPLATQQWHLLNAGQTGYADIGGTAGYDINVNPVYTNYGFGGAGVVAAVVDSGLEIAHEDLATNVVPGGSWNFLNSTTDPTNTVDTTGDHGTSVGGLIAMARNSVGGLGVAPETRLKGFNYLQLSSIANHLASLGGSTARPNSADVHLFNQSFGIYPTTDTRIDPTIEAQYFAGVTTLRGGKGALYVKSGGNGFLAYGTANCTDANGVGLSCGNSSFDPERTIPYQIVVAAINARGVRSSYSTAGSAIWVSAPGGEYGKNAALSGATGTGVEPAMVTTDQSACTTGYALASATTSYFDQGTAPNSSCNYTSSFNGTSSAAPVASGVIALILEANPALTWREVKDILARTARKIDTARVATSLTLSNGSFVAVPAWITNAAGYNFHNWYGFGLVDAKAAVDLARIYPRGSLGTFGSTGWIASPALALAIPDNSTTGATHTLNVPTSGIVEAVQIKVSAAHPWNGDLAIELTSPSGTRSVLKTGKDAFDGINLTGMVLLSNAFYGEPRAGNWTIKLVDVWTGSSGTLTGWSIRIYSH